jgi:hypothetical protein
MIRLLLESLFKKTDQDHTDYEQLQQAIESVAEAANYQNARIKETNNIMRVHQIAQKLHMESLILPSRRVHKEGVLYLDNERNACDTYLFNDVLILEEKKKKMKLRPVVHVFEFYKVFIGGGNDLIVSLNYSADSGRVRKHDIIFLDHNMKKEWMEEITRLLSEYRQQHAHKDISAAIPLRRKGSSIRSPRIALGSLSNMFKRVTATPRQKHEMKYNY